MEEIEVGEYVRTKSGDIGKVISEFGSSIRIVFKNEEWGIRKDKEDREILSHSKNIIDLIEEGDVVKYKLKGLSVSGIRIVKKHIDARTSKENLLVQGFMLEQLEIKSIVTKEQFASIEFRLED